MKNFIFTFLAFIICTTVKSQFPIDATTTCGNQVSVPVPDAYGQTITLLYSPLYPFAVHGNAYATSTGISYTPNAGFSGIERITVLYPITVPNFVDTLVISIEVTCFGPSGQSPTNLAILISDSLLLEMGDLTCSPCHGKKFKDKIKKANEKLTLFRDGLSGCHHSEPSNDFLGHPIKASDVLKKLKDAAQELGDAKKEAIKANQPSLTSEIDGLLVRMVEIAKVLAKGAKFSAGEKQVRGGLGNSGCGGCNPFAGDANFSWASLQNSAEKKIDKYNKAFEDWAGEECSYYDGSCGAPFSCSNPNFKKEKAIEETTTMNPITKLSIYPNPFIDETTMEFSTVQTQRLTLTIFNVLGTEVSNLFEGTLESGKTQKIIFNPENLAPGLYFARLFTDAGEVRFEKLILQR